MASKAAIALGLALLSCGEARRLASAGSAEHGCTSCHGSANAAPPRDLHGNEETSAPGVGAHQAHLTAANGLGPPLDCVFCHRKPAGVGNPGHIDGKVEVTAYTGTDPVWQAIIADPGWDEPSRSCATAYCHGATLGGGSNTHPTWTRVDGTQAACGTCHGLPPAALPSPSHPSYLFGAPCIGCHPGTASWDAVTQTNGIQGGGQHLDGAIQFTFGGHPPGWAAAGGGAHSARAPLGCLACGGITMAQYYDQCTPCHGRNGDFTPDGGPVRVSCGACHAAFFDAGGTTSCSFCH